jgi:hypothetical protein
MPDMTRVAECSSDETGVGPSMASGNHRKETTRTDLNEQNSKMVPTMKRFSL